MTKSTRDRILLTDLAFYGYHGVMLEENKLGQRFRVDLEVGIDLAPAATTDDVDKTISYDLIFSLVKQATEDTRYKLIEALAQHVVDRLFEQFAAAEWVRIRIRKPEAPIPAVAGEFAVEIFREREA